MMTDSLEQVDEPIEGQGPPPTNVAVDERWSPAAAQAIIERLFPDAACRQAALAAFVHAIRVAHAAGPAAWGVTLHRDRVQLNVNRVVVCTLMRPALWVALATGAVDQTALPQLRELQGWQENAYRSVPASAAGYLTCAQLATVLPTASPLHRSLPTMYRSAPAQGRPYE